MYKLQAHPLRHESSSLDTCRLIFPSSIQPDRCSSIALRHRRIRVWQRYCSSSDLRSRIRLPDHIHEFCLGDYVWLDLVADHRSLFVGIGEAD